MEAAGIAPAVLFPEVFVPNVVTTLELVAGRKWAGRTRHSSSWSQTGTLWHLPSWTRSWNWCGRLSLGTRIEGDQEPNRQGFSYREADGKSRLDEALRRGMGARDAANGLGEIGESGRRELAGGVCEKSLTMRRV